MYAAHRRHGAEEVSQVKKTTLNPIWNETFAFPYSRGPDDSQPPSLGDRVHEDVDTVTAADFMGLVRVELDPLKDHKRLKKWLPLQARSDDDLEASSKCVSPGRPRGVDTVLPVALQPRVGL